MSHNSTGTSSFTVGLIQFDEPWRKPPELFFLRIHTTIYHVHARGTLCAKQSIDIHHFPFMLGTTRYLGANGYVDVVADSWLVLSLVAYAKPGAEAALVSSVIEAVGCRLGKGQLLYGQCGGVVRADAQAMLGMSGRCAVSSVKSHNVPTSICPGSISLIWTYHWKPK